jgi:DNA modification methylase
MESTTKAIHSPDRNRVAIDDKPIHDWYRFVLSYPPHLVRDYLEKFEVTKQQWVLDPFSGTGTTLVEAKKLGIPSCGIEANSMAFFASRVKLNWDVSPKKLVHQAQQIAESVVERLRGQGIDDDLRLPLFDANSKRNKQSDLRTLSEEQTKLLLANSISPLPLHKTLELRDAINQSPKSFAKEHLLLALAKSTVANARNLHFGPEVGVTKPKQDASVVGPWLQTIESMAADLRLVAELKPAESRVLNADARQSQSLLKDTPIDAVITSPPYPNEKDYTRTTRLESVLLGFLTDKASLRALKKGLLRSNTRNVYKDDDDIWVRDHAEIQRIATEIEAKRIELGKTSGFERMYHRVTNLYFGGMSRHFSELTHVLRPGAKLAYVVGDQASYLQIMIRTGEILADLAKSQGYRVLGIDLFRTRLATATKQQLREEVVLLEWPGKKKLDRSRGALAATNFAGKCFNFGKSFGSKIRSGSRLNKKVVNGQGTN